MWQEFLPYDFANNKSISFEKETQFEVRTTSLYTYNKSCHYNIKNFQLWCCHVCQEILFIILLLFIIILPVSPKNL